MAYEHTLVAPEKSQGKIRQLLQTHGGSDMAIASRFAPPMEGFQARIIIDEKPYLMRIAAPLRQKKKDKDQELRRVWRVIFHHLKAIFEAADSGVIELRELILPFLVTESGKTVAQIILHQLNEKIQAPPQKLLDWNNDL